MDNVKKLWPLLTATHRYDKSISTHGRGAGEMIDAPVLAYLIETANGRILYDVGCDYGKINDPARCAHYYDPQKFHFGAPAMTEAQRLPSYLARLGLSPVDIDVVFIGHLHFDHAGGLGELQRLTGARAAASASSAKVLTSGESGPDDPQYGILPPIDRLRNVDVVREGQVVKVGSLIARPHMAPGHTPGGTTWTWKSCEGDRCLDVVYADSVTPVSADGFKYATSPLSKAFEQTFAALETMRCDILLTPHPAFAQVLEKLAAREMGKTDAFIDPGACRAYAATGRKNLATRLETERKGK